MTGGAVRVRRIFDRFAGMYDSSALQRVIYRPAQDAVAAEVRAAGAERVLDVGCGTGILASRIGEESRRATVVGCDLSLGMLRQAAARRRGAWLQGDALRLPVRDGALDAVVSTQAFHFMPDRVAALREFRRVLGPGGLLVIAMVNPHSELVSRLMSGAADRVLGLGAWPTRGVLRAEVEAAGFEVRTQRHARDLAHTVITVATARRQRSRRSRPTPQEG